MTFRPAVLGLGWLLIAGGGACAQEPPNPLAGIPAPVRYSPPEQATSDYAFVCEGGRYHVALEQVASDGPEARRVSLVALETPSGPLASDDHARLNAVLQSFGLLFAVDLQCHGDVFGLTFLGRRPADEDNSSVRVWFEDGRITRID